MQQLNIDLGTRSYPIVIGEDVLADRKLLARLLPHTNLLVVTNDTVARLHLPELIRGLGDRTAAVHTLPDGEEFKNHATLNSVFDALVSARLHRDGAIVALGGGVVGDIGGFAAACYQRGIAYLQVPTTLLAQVDSAVGGKTGINHETNVWFEITTLLIPGANDSESEVDALSGWVIDKLGPDVPLHFTAFHPDWKMMDRPPTPAATLIRARDIALKNGLRYVYTGNIHDFRDGRRLKTLPVEQGCGALENSLSGLLSFAHRHNLRPFGLLVQARFCLRSNRLPHRWVALDSLCH